MPTSVESVGEVMPWDLEENISDSDLILLDIREQEEFNRKPIFCKVCAASTERLPDRQINTMF
jgi:rhodanese-related sulfurtransferase